jgi:alpha/beta superfamily hydrolase
MTRPAAERLLLGGPAGNIETAIDFPETEARGVALVAHPHPLFGGTLDNKVAQTLARVFYEMGYIALRPNFRGVGASEGVHDEGRGEVDDMVAVIAYARQRFGELPVALAGFSFGAFVQTRVAKLVKPERMALVGTSVTRSAAETVPPDTILIHGELDETVPLAEVMVWALPQELPVVVIPGADHFFHRRLHIIRNIVNSMWHARAQQA